MLLYITLEDHASGGWFSASSEFCPSTRDFEIRLLNDFPDEAWSAGNMNGFPIGADGTSDEYWEPYYRQAVRVWRREPAWS